MSNHSQLSAYTRLLADGLPRFARRHLCLAAAGAIAFCVFTVLVGAHRLDRLDWSILFAAQALRDDALEWGLSLFSYPTAAETSVALAVLWALGLRRRGYHLAAVAPLLFVLTVPVEFAFKLLLDHPGVPDEFYRPGLGYHLIGIKTIGSYPSGHAARSMFFGALAWLQVAPLPDRARWLAYGAIVVLEALMAANRIYLGVHWATDVVGGWALGFAVAMLAGALLACRPKDPGTINQGRTACAQ